MIREYKSMLVFLPKLYMDKMILFSFKVCTNKQNIMLRKKHYERAWTYLLYLLKPQGGNVIYTNNWGVLINFKGGRCNLPFYFRILFNINSY